GGDRVAYVECPPASFTGPLDSVSLDGSGRVQLNPPGSTVKPGVFRNLLSPDRTDIVFPSIAGGQTSILRAALDGSPAPRPPPRRRRPGRRAQDPRAARPAPAQSDFARRCMDRTNAGRRRAPPSD